MLRGLISVLSAWMGQRNMKYNSTYHEVQARYHESIRKLNEEVARSKLARIKSAIQIEAEKGLIIEGTVNDQAHGSR